MDQLRLPRFDEENKTWRLRRSTTEGDRNRLVRLDDTFDARVVMPPERAFLNLKSLDLYLLHASQVPATLLYFTDSPESEDSVQDNAARPGINTRRELGVHRTEINI